MCKRHKWQAVGGCSENPGVWDNGNGGLKYVSECANCGIVRKSGSDYTGCRPGNNWGPNYYTPSGERCNSRGEVLCG